MHFTLPCHVDVVCPLQTAQTPSYLFAVARLFLFSALLRTIKKMTWRRFHHKSRNMCAVHQSRRIQYEHEYEANLER